MNVKCFGQIRKEFQLHILVILQLKYVCNELCAPVGDICPHASNWAKYVPLKAIPEHYQYNRFTAPVH